VGRWSPGRYLTVFIALLVLIAGSLSGRTAAAPAGPQSPTVRHPLSGITISPSFQQVVVGQNDTEKPFTFSVTNNTGQQVEVALSTVDFGSLDESGGVLFMGQNNKSINYKYGLSQYVTLGQDRLVVDPKSTTKIPVTITNKESLSPGGHYGAILVTPTKVGDNPSKVEINQIISSLLFVTKQGGAIYQLNLQNYQLKTHIFSPPTSVDLRFQNAGNVHLIPRGMITITDPRGVIVRRGFINEGSAIVLPETFRKLSVPLRTVNRAWWPGIYHVTMSYRFDGQETNLTKQLSFYYINGWYIVAAIVIMALIILAIVLKPVRRFFRATGRFLSWPFRWLFRTIRRSL
jgi:hypothetical protein